MPKLIQIWSLKSKPLQVHLSFWHAWFTYFSISLVSSIRRYSGPISYFSLPQFWNQPLCKESVFYLVEKGLRTRFGSQVGSRLFVSTLFQLSEVQIHPWYKYTHAHICILLESRSSNWHLQCQDMPPFTPFLLCICPSHNELLAPNSISIFIYLICA